MVSPFMPDDEKVGAVREALPATGAGIYFNTGSAGPLPNETAKAMADLADWELRTGRSHYDYYEESLVRMDETRAAVAAILTADVDSIALTHATTDGLNVGAWAVDWQRGDRVVTTNLEHQAGLAPLWVLRERLGVDVAVVDIGDGGDDRQTLAALDAAITPRTKLVALSHVSWATGAVLPIRAIAEVARPRGALVSVDGAQAAGAFSVDAASIGADFYAVPAHKWLLGPEGVGALYCAPGALDRARLTFAGSGSFETLDEWARGTLWPSARRFESSNLHRPSIVGFARSCGWLSMYVGLDWIYRRGAWLAQRAADLLGATPGVDLVTPRDHMASLVTFRINGWPPEDALEELGRRVFVIARTVPHLEAIRISVGFFNTEAEIETFCAAVADLGRYTPETLPRRRTLTILGSDER